MAQGKGVLSSAVALSTSAVGISEALFSFRKDIDAWLKNELRGEAIRLGAEIVSVSYD